MLRQARRRGLTIPILGGDGLEGIEAAGALAEGVYLIVLLPDLLHRANRKFVEATATSIPSGKAQPARPRKPTTPSISCATSSPGRAPTVRRCATRSPASVPLPPAFERRDRDVAFDKAGDVPEPERLHRQGSRRHGRGGQPRTDIARGRDHDAQPSKPGHRWHGAADRPRLR